MANEEHRKPEELFELAESIGAFLDADGDALTEEQEASVAPILNSLYESRYHFSDEEFLISGGEKKISKVYDTFANRHVAMAHPLHCETRSEKEKFLREAQLTSKLQHPNILPIYEIGVDDQDMPFFVMRLLEGKELKTVVLEKADGQEQLAKRYSLDDLLEIFLKVCDATIYAHSRGVLHLDLKPMNIVMGKYGQVVLYDWGLAQVVDPSRGIQLDEQAEPFDSDLLNNVTSSGMLKGTPGYMAPEQVEPDGQVSTATDVYGLGAILYFILTGTIPVRGAHAQEIMQNTREGNVVRPRLRRPQLGIPGSLGAIAMKALQLKPESRYASVQELRDEVMRYLRGYAPKAERATPPKHLQLLMRRHSRVAMVIFLSSMLLTAVITSFYSREKLQSQKLEAARTEAVHNLDRFLEEKEHSDQLYTDQRSFIAEVGILGTLHTHGLLDSIVSRELKKENLESEYRKKLVWIQVMLELAYQNFHTAQTLIKAHPEYEQDLRRYDSLSSKYGAMKEHDNDQLTDAQFAEFLKEPITRRHFKELKTLAYELHMQRRDSGSPESYLAVAIAMLNVINDTEGWGGHVRLEPREGGYHLNFSDAPYRVYNLSRMRPRAYDGVLGQLDLVSLDLSRSAPSNIEDFRMLNKLETLIVLDIEPLRENVFFRMVRKLPVKRVVLRKGLHQDKWIEQLRESHEVILVPPGETWSSEK